MDPLTAQWLSELEVDGPDVIHQWQLKSVSDSLDDVFMNEYSRFDAVPEASSQAWISQPAKQVKINNDLSPCTASFFCNQQEVSSAPSTEIFSFGDLTCSSPQISMDDLHRMTSSGPISWGSVDEELYGDVPIKQLDGTRTPLQTQHRALEEKKRRRKLNHLLIDLATIIPGLKKLDKATILAGAFNHIKQLEQRIKSLEEEKKGQYEKSVLVASKRPRLPSYDQSSPEIEVRTCNENVLLGIYCKNRPEIIKDIFCEIEKLHLCIISTSVLPFGNTQLHITIHAQVSGEFCKAQDLANTIRQTILNLM